MFHVIPFYVRVCDQIEGSDSYFGASLVAQTVKNLSVMQETQVRSLGWENPLEKEMATHSSTPLPGEFQKRGAGQATVHGVTNSQT